MPDPSETDPLAKSTAEILAGLHVLQILPSLESGGVEQGTLDIASALIQAGAKADVAAMGGRLVGSLEKEGATFHALPVHSKNPLVMIANVARLRRLIRRQGINIVHARSRAPAWSALLAARLAGVPFVTTYHGTYTEQSFFKRLYNSVMARGDLVIANSLFISEQIKTRYKLPSERIIEIARGVDLSQYDPKEISPERVQKFREACGLSPQDNQMVILMPGRLTAWKGHEVMIEALALLRMSAPADLAPFICICLGDHQSRHFKMILSKRIETEGLKPYMRLAGYYNDMPAAYAGSDIVVSPSVEPEAFGRVAIEAQAMMKPVIAADHGGARETIIAPSLGTVIAAGEDHISGLRVKPGDPNALAEALYELLRLAPEKRESIGANGRRHVSAHFSLVSMCERTLAVYVWLARKARGES